MKWAKVFLRAVDIYGVSENATQCIIMLHFYFIIQKRADNLILAYILESDCGLTQT